MTINATDFREGLLSAGLLLDGGAPGLYHRSDTFEAVVRSVEGFVRHAGRDERARRLFFAPVVAISTLEGSGYVSSFPNLLGTVSSFNGDDARLVELHRRLADGTGWLEMFSPTEVGLGSAACHPLFPTLAGTVVPETGLTFEVQAFCFRHEPSDVPSRMQSFRQQEFVFVGAPDAALDFRDRWLTRAVGMLGSLGLPVESVEANDPFFGRAGRLLAAGQMEKKLKFEVVSPLSLESPTAIASANYHEDHFGSVFDVRRADGDVAHSACIGFGLERIALALLFHHGLDVASWPTSLTESLGLGTAAEPRG